MNGDVFDVATGPVPGDREYPRAGYYRPIDSISTRPGADWCYWVTNRHLEADYATGRVRCQRDPNPFPHFRLFRWLPWR